MTTQKKPHIKIRLLRNVRVSIGTYTPTLRTEMKQLPTSHGIAIIPTFDLSEIFEVPVHDERVLVPQQPASMSDRRYDQIVDAAHELAQKNTDLNAAIRADIKSYVENGDLEVLDDLYSVLSEPEMVEFTTIGKSVKSSAESLPKAARKHVKKAAIR